MAATLYLACRTCRTEVRVPPSRQATFRYCSRACRMRWAVAQQTVTRPCPICGRLMRRRHYQLPRTCGSPECEMLRWNR